MLDWEARLQKVVFVANGEPERVSLGRLPLTHSISVEWELNRAGWAEIICNLAALNSDVSEHLITIGRPPLEIVLTRKGETMWAGPVISFRKVDRDNLSIRAAGYLHYLDIMALHVPVKDEQGAWDAANLAATLVRRGQHSLPTVDGYDLNKYGDWGIKLPTPNQLVGVTVHPGRTDDDNVERERPLLPQDTTSVLGHLIELAERDGEHEWDFEVGLDRVFSVGSPVPDGEDPVHDGANRNPRIGEDKSETVWFDVTDLAEEPDVQLSLSPSNFCSVVYGVGEGVGDNRIVDDEGNDTHDDSRVWHYAVPEDPEDVFSEMGVRMHLRSFTGVVDGETDGSEVTAAERGQAIEDLGKAYLLGRQRPWIIPNFTISVVPGAPVQVDSFSVGDKVSYYFDAGFGAVASPVSGARVNKKTLRIMHKGPELMDVEFE